MAQLSPSLLHSLLVCCWQGSIDDIIRVEGVEDDDDGIEDVVDGEDGDALVSHVDEPLEAQGVSC